LWKEEHNKQAGFKDLPEKGSNILGEKTFFWKGETGKSPKRDVDVAYRERSEHWEKLTGKVRRVQMREELALV